MIILAHQLGSMFRLSVENWDGVPTWASKQPFGHLIA
jgi:hypothetical protein